MPIRAFCTDDAADIARIFHESVHGIGAQYYTPEQCHAWSPHPFAPEGFAEKAADGRHVFVATNVEDRPVAFIELETDGHIDCFYCAPNAAGKGGGSGLYDHLEFTARSLGINRLFVEASEAAKPLFSHKGFRLIRRRDFLRRGISIHHYLME